MTSSLCFHVSHPHEMSDGDGEANGEGSRSQTSVSPLIGHGEDAHHKLHGEENLHSGGHSQTDARLQLETHRWKKMFVQIKEIMPTFGHKAAESMCSFRDVFSVT